MVFWQYSLYPDKSLHNTCSSLNILKISANSMVAMGSNPQYEPSATGVGININSTPKYIG